MRRAQKVKIKGEKGVWGSGTKMGKVITQEERSAIGRDLAANGLITPIRNPNLVDGGGGELG